MDDAEERAHYESVLLSFREYEAFVMREIFRRKQHMLALPKDMQRRLPQTSTLRNIHHFVNAAHHNQVFLERIVQAQLDSGPHVDLPTVTPQTPLKSPIRHLSKLKSTLHQFVRDWSEEGAKEREMCYGPILRELKRIMPVTDQNKNQQRVLVPGAGLGRLALEIAAKGYASQGNEFSYQMLFASNFILNWTTRPGEFEIHPWIHNPSNALSITDLLRPVVIPDKSPSELLGLDKGNQPDFSMCAGEFLEAYAKEKECWDCIVTCFFIDAAPNVIEYIAAFERLLKPGGHWVNLGPLLYHWQNSGGDDDERFNQSVELTLEEIKHVMSTYNFSILKESQRECVYTNNIKSMMKTAYNCSFFTAVKETPIQAGVQPKKQKKETRRLRKMDRLQRLFGNLPGIVGQSGPGSDAPLVDTAEKVHISSLALLKMLKHGRAGVPMEVMGLMLGEFVDDYTVNCIDVFAMPQSGTGVSVEAVDPVFQTKMLDMLKQTGRAEMVVGWYHSHPGFGCWLSGVDINTQQSFEALNNRAVAVVVDPIQSVKGKVVIDAFRLINSHLIMLGQEPRQTTSNIGHLNKPSIQALIHGLNRHYYSIAIDYRKNELEEQMLMNLHKNTWSDGLVLTRFEDHSAENENTVKNMLALTEQYNKRVQEEEEKTPEELEVLNVGKIDPKKHLESDVYDLMALNTVQCLGAMLDTIVF
ncbi:TPA: hypothetical protein N0F65_011254 [Lagenidium giganteum]|uniref:carnosine N-methyltransferase n=1 Tax=Lagenidium giganteum TaxID=4803 RepID=A0AAV2Z2P9_9STRA|nr:TPA: hypothetical protein N0F65_011254 [Lagenidium giganteum]